MSATIPILDLGPEIARQRAELEVAFARVLDSGRFIGGPEVEAFEAEAAEYLGAEHAVGLNSGTDALVIALRALGVGPGDEVITTPFSFFATAEAISHAGATPVFVDIDERTFNLDPTLLDDAVSDRTRAVLPVHLYGRPAPMREIVEAAERHGLAVVEDCAQSFGAVYGGEREGEGKGSKTGTLGAAGCFSFFPSKNLGAFGDGGMLSTNDIDLANHARMLRAHGGAHKYENERLGYNSRLDALQAAFLRVRLAHVESGNATRRVVAARYAQALAEVDGIVLPELVAGHVFHQYTIRVLGGRRDAVRRSLAEDGVQTMVYYPTPIHHLPVYVDRGWGPFPVAERLAGEVLSLPIGPSISEADQEQVIGALRAALPR